MTMNDTPAETTETQEPKPDRVEATAAKDPIVRYFIVTAMLLAAGAYFFYDGYFTDKYPHKPFAEDLNAWFGWFTNCVVPFFLVPLGLFFLVKAVLFAKRRLVADAAGIGYSGKPQIRWDEISEVDATLLKSKGYLYIHYGEDKKLTLDDWKIQGFREVAAFVEDHLPPEKIRR